MPSLRNVNVLKAEVEILLVVRRVVRSEGAYVSAFCAEVGRCAGRACDQLYRT